MFVTKRDGTIESLDVKKIQRAVAWMCQGLNVSQSDLETSARLPLINRVTTLNIQRTLIVEAASKISPKEPEWTYVAARGLLQMIYKHANEGSIDYPHLQTYIQRGVAIERLDPILLTMFDLEALNSVIVPDRDLDLDYLGLQTLSDRYFIRDETEESMIIELPQFFFMRVAMGVALAEKTVEARTKWAIEYYQMYSKREALSSTPTLFNSGTNWPQLSSCFGQTYGDDTDLIMDGLKESANYSKFSGGVAIDVGGIRANGSKIRSTGGKAGGPIPYIKLYNGVMLGFDQSGKRRGAGSVYMEPWHPDIFKFLDLREPGDDRVRAHDVFPALWIPDLFMKRVETGGVWSLIDPNEEPRLHETYGEEFEELYTELEASGRFMSQLPANDLWARILERLFTHGVFWPCFKDTANARYAQPEIIHNSNLCTEIMLRNDSKTAFVCNLASINVGSDKHLLEKGSDGKYLWNSELEANVRRIIRNLDSVISIGFIPYQNGRTFQEQDRAIGMGCMGWADALAKMGIDYESKDHIVYANEVWKQMSLAAIDESANLAQELGSYPRFASSMWADGMLPVDTLRHNKVVKDFGLDLEATTPFGTLDDLRAKVKRGMRNSCLMAIAPTATIANIIGAGQACELAWELGYQKKNLSGKFNVFATTLLNNRHGLKLKTARQVDQMWTIWAAAARQIWIDQSQSTNLFLNPNVAFDDIGQMVEDLYFEAWRCGVKSTYYFYARAVETDAIDIHQLAGTPEPQIGDELLIITEGDPNSSSSWTGGKVCAIDAGPDCEACQ